MANRPNPLALTVLGELNFDGFAKQFKRLTTRIEKDDGSRAEWLDTCRTIEKQLRGTTERRNPPWKGACELAPPLTKRELRRWIPNMFNLAALADPISSFQAKEPNAAAVAPIAEEFFTWLIKDHMDDTLSEIAYLAQGVGSKGQDYVGVSWAYQTELETRVIMVENLWPQGPPDDRQQIMIRLQSEYDIVMPTEQTLKDLRAAADAIAQGAQYVRLEYRRVIKDKPKFTWWPSGRVIVSPRSGDPEEAPYVCLVHDMSPSELRQLAQDDVLNAAAVESVISSKGAGKKGQDETVHLRSDFARNDSIEREQLHEAGVGDIDEEDTIRIHQVYCKMDKNGDGIDERIVLWYAPGNEPVSLAVHDFPFSFKYWPVFRFNYELVDRRPHRAQGMGQQLQAIQAQYTKQYRATADAIDIQLAPVFQFRYTSKLQPRSIKWGPGKLVPVSQVGDIAEIAKSPLNLHEYLQDRGELKMFAQELVGSVPGELNATGSKLERRTAFEVQKVSGQVEAMQGMDAAIWQLAMQKVFQCIWEMWLDFGPAEVYYNVTSEQQPKPFRKSEHNYKYQLIPSGTPGNTNRQAQLSRLIEVVQIFAQFAPDLMNREFVLRQIATLLDPRLAKQIVLPAQQQRANQILQEMAAAVAKGDIPQSALALMGRSEGEGAATA